MCTYDDVVVYNTEDMKDWSETTKNAGENFEQMVSELYNLVDHFVADEFTGNLSESFHDTVLSQREYYSNLRDTIDESANLIRSHATQYEDNESSLSSQINNNNLGGN